MIKKCIWVAPQHDSVGCYKTSCISIVAWVDYDQLCRFKFCPFCGHPIQLEDDDE